MNKKICIVYTHHKLGDLIWQLPYIKAIRDHHNEKIDLIVRKKSQALITDPNHARKHVLSMVKNQAINCFSGKQIPCEIDSVCIHGDNESSLATAKSIRDNMVESGLNLKALNKMQKFI